MKAMYRLWSRSVSVPLLTMTTASVCMWISHPILTMRLGGGLGGGTTINPSSFSSSSGGGVGGGGTGGGVIDRGGGSRRAG